MGAVPEIVTLPAVAGEQQDLAAAALDHTGRRLSGRRDCPVRAELHSGWNHRRFRPGLAVDCGGVVCAADGVEVDRQE